jgi:hypothetical protein
MTEESVTPQDEVEVFIEFPEQEGLVKASLGDGLERLKAESEKAMNVTMGVIRVMADKVAKAIDTIEDEVRPNEMEVEFSLKLDIEGGTVIPMIAKTTAGGQFNIRFKWTLEKPNRPTVLVSENK